LRVRRKEVSKLEEELRESVLQLGRRKGGRMVARK